MYDVEACLLGSTKNYACNCDPTLLLLSKGQSGGESKVDGGLWPSGSMRFVEFAK